MGSLVSATKLLRKSQGVIPSLVMKEINSLTHSCMHSFASFAILAFSGSAVFMIRATGAKFLMLASDEVSCFPGLVARGGSGEEESWDMIGLVNAVTPLEVKRLHKELNDWPIHRTCACNGGSDASRKEAQHAENSLCANQKRGIKD